MRIFLDANILFSAIKSDGAMRKMIQLLVESGHELIADSYVFEEAKRNLQAKYSIDVRDEKQVLDYVQVVAMPRASELPTDVELVDKDRQVLASAISLHCDALVTGDAAHFGHLFGQQIGGVTVHSPRSIAESLL